MALDKQKLATMVKKNAVVVPPRLGKRKPPPADPNAPPPAAPGAPPSHAAPPPGAAAASPPKPPAKPGMSLGKKLLGAKAPAGPPALPGAVKPPDDNEAGAPQPGNAAEGVEHAAQAAEAGADAELEDILAGTEMPPPSDGTGEPPPPPPWATDPQKWQEAADAVGLGDPDMEARYDEPFVVAAYLYKQMGGPISPDALAEVSPAGGAPGGAAGGSGDVVQDATAERAANPDPAIEQAMQGYDPATHGDPPSFVADAATWEAAKAAVEAAGPEQHADPHTVIAYVYKKMGGKMKQAGAAATGAAPPPVQPKV